MQGRYLITVYVPVPSQVLLTEGQKYHQNLEGTCIVREPIGYGTMASTEKIYMKVPSTLTACERYLEWLDTCKTQYTGTENPKRYIVEWYHVPSSILKASVRETVLYHGT